MRKAKRKLAALLVLAMVFALLPTLAPTAQARSHNSTDIVYPVTGGNLYFNKTYGTITDCDDYVTKAIIPAQIDGVAVTAIGDFAFERRYSLQSVEIPDSVTEIGNRAFGGCMNLQSVEIPDSVTEIGDSAFSSCASLQSVTIPNSVTEIGWSAFFSCESLQSIEIPNGVTEIGYETFCGCTSLQSIEVPNSVTSIGSYAFEYCKSLQSIEIPNSVTEIGWYAFSGCTSLQSIEIPDSVTKIGNSAFVGCTSLQSVEIPGSVTEIGDVAFYNCASLQSVTIPSSVTEIGSGAFARCAGLYEINVAADNSAYCSREGVLFLNDGKILCILPARKPDNRCTIPSGVMSIGGAAFGGCTGLQSVEIPNSVTEIDDEAFLNCTSLKTVLFLGNAPALGRGVFRILNWKYEDIPGLTLYYIEGKEGWTTPTWKGYPTRTWDGKTTPSQFTDVAANSWFADAVKYAVTNNLFNGTGDGTTFSPNMAMSRAMLVTVLHRQADKPASSGENVFSDVPNTSWYTKAVLWASENGIVTGSNGKFMPNAAVTREQISVILFRYTQKQGKDTSDRADLTAFPDGDLVSGWAKDAMQWAVAEKLISGNTKGELMPKGEASRAQVATILMRYIENILQ